MRPRLVGLGLAASCVVLLADQASKLWILDILRLPDLGRINLLPVLSLTMVWNQGVTFGMFKADGRWGALLLAAVAACIVVALGLWLRRAETRLVAIALGAIAGGAIGNVIDRIRFGAVVDFIHLHVDGWSWYVFNVADAAIVCGVAALVLDGLRPHKPAAPSSAAPPNAAPSSAAPFGAAPSSAAPSNAARPGDPDPAARAPLRER